MELNLIHYRDGSEKKETQVCGTLYHTLCRYVRKIEKGDHSCQHQTFTDSSVRLLIDHSMFHKHMQNCNGSCVVLYTGMFRFLSSQKQQQ